MLDADSVRRGSDLLRIVQSYGIELNKQGSRWFGRCPWHNDSTPSFSVYEHHGVMRCGCMGCDTLRNGDVIDFVATMEHVEFQEAIKRVAEFSGIVETPIHVKPNGHAKPKEETRIGRTLAIYTYQDADGGTVFEVLRKEVLDSAGKPIEGKKSFVQRRPDGHGWSWKTVAAAEKVLYRLPQVLAAHTTVIVEGEKDVHSIERYGVGVVGTTNAGGAKAAWESQYTESLQGKHVIVCGDTDEPGRARDEKILAALHGVERLERVRLPEPFKDVTEYFEAGNSWEDWLALVEPCEIPPTPKVDKGGQSRGTRGDKGGQEGDDDPIREEAPGDWRGMLLVTKDLNPKASIANVITALRGAPEWREVLWYSEFSGGVYARAPFPGQKNLREDTAWSDTFDTIVCEWMHHQGICVSTDIVGKAVQLVATDHPFHPVRDYLKGLEWDGMPRLDWWLREYLGAPASNYTAAVGAAWMISAVARIFRPGCKADCCLILEGEQGIKKSTALRTLAGEWFTDELAEMGSKDAGLQLQDVWIVELSELDAMRRSEISAVKAFMSRPDDRFRPPYGRRTIKFPRQCIFGASTNQDTYFGDETGNRRFWPIRCGETIDIDALVRDRDQLWAESVSEFEAGRKWWLQEASIIKEAEAEQSSRYEPDAWEEQIEPFINTRKTSGVSVSEILGAPSCLNKPAKDWTHGDHIRVGRCMHRLGWVKRRPGSRETDRERKYYPKSATPDDQLF